MTRSIAIALTAAAALVATAAVARAQTIPVTKDGGRMELSNVTTTDYGDIEFTGPLGYTLRPSTQPIYCNDNDVEEVQKVTIKSELYQTGMITPDQAKALALCVVPGQIGSGEMDTSNGRTIYDITLIPNDKKTYSKVQIDAYTGEVINAKQFGGLRGLAGFLRESAERKENKAKAPNTP